jgi:hypothetical protein
MDHDTRTEIERIDAALKSAQSIMASLSNENKEMKDAWKHLTKDMSTALGKAANSQLQTLEKKNIILKNGLKELVENVLPTLAKETETRLQTLRYAFTLTSERVTSLEDQIQEILNDRL